MIAWWLMHNIPCHHVCLAHHDLWHTTRVQLAGIYACRVIIELTPSKVQHGVFFNFAPE